MVGVSSIRARGAQTLDSFGTVEIYPTKSGGLERAVDMVTSTPASAGLRSHFNGATWVKSGDGLYWQVTPDGSGLGRVGLNSTAGNKWDNFESTVYLIRTAGDSQFQLGWGGLHYNSPQANQGYGYALKTRFTGSVFTTVPQPVTSNVTYFVKEYAHDVTNTTYATPQTGVHGGVKISITGAPNNLTTHNLLAWQGYKFIKRSFLDGTRHKVRLYAYIDVNCGPITAFVRNNNWVLINTWDDAGLWAAGAAFVSNAWPTLDIDSVFYEADYSNTARTNTEIFNTAGPGYAPSETTINDAYIRTDGGTNYGLRDFTVREIDAI